MDDLYIKSYNGKFIKVTHLTIGSKDANDYLGRHPEEGVLKEIKGVVFIANCEDFGVLGEE